MVSPTMIASLILCAAAAISSCPSVLSFAPAQSHGRAKFIPSPTVRAINAEVPNKGNKSMQNIHGGYYNSQRPSALIAYETANPGEESEGGDGADEKDAFWARQRALAAQMTSKADDGLKREQRDKFAARRLALTSDTFYFSVLIGCALWLVSPDPFVTISYLFGALLGTAYSYGLGKYVETIGGSIDDVEVEGAGVGSARFAFLILLFVFVGKFRDQGLLEIPSIAGFFTYQLASLNQGLREIDD